MNLIRRRLFACVLAVMLCMAAFPISAFADGGDYYDYELPPNYYDYAQEYYPDYSQYYQQPYTPTPLYPDGNMSILHNSISPGSGIFQLIISSPGLIINSTF